MGETKVNSVSPITVLTEFVSHTAFVATSAFIIAKLGDSDLFNGTIPITVTLKRYNQLIQQTINQ